MFKLGANGPAPSGNVDGSASIFAAAAAGSTAAAAISSASASTAVSATASTATSTVVVSPLLKWKQAPPGEEVVIYHANSPVGAAAPARIAGADSEMKRKAQALLTGLSTKLRGISDAKLRNQKIDQVHSMFVDKRDHMMHAYGLKLQDLLTFIAAERAQLAQVRK